MEKKNNIGTALELRDFTLRGFTLNMESRRLPHSLASVIVHSVLRYGSLSPKLGLSVGLLAKPALHKQSRKSENTNSMAWQFSFCQK